MIQKILFPVDFSHSCVAMAAFVQRAAAMFGAKVTLVHVCELVSKDGFELYSRPPGDIAQDHWNVARSKLELFLASEFPAGNCPRILLSGDAATGIVETAKKNKSDLIIMPTHAGRFRQMLLGSTTAKVLNDTDCPVLTTQHAEAITPRPLEHLQWVCAAGLSSHSEGVVRYAKDAALAARSKLSVIHVIEADKPESEEERKVRQRIAQLQDIAGSEASVRVASGPLKETLLDAVRQASADILVIGRSPHGGAHGRMRDLAYTLIRDSPCPVVSV